MGSVNTAQGSTEARRREDPEFPGWRLWHSDAGKPYATRLPAVLTAEQQRLNCAMTVGGENTEDLRTQLLAQRELDAQAAAVEEAKG